MAWQGDVLWVAEPEAQSVHKFKLESGRLRDERSIPLPGSRVTGLAATEDSLYVADAAANVIQRRRTDDALTLEKSWPVAAQNISALASDGTSLFAAFSKPGRIYQYALDEDLSVVGTFFGPGFGAGIVISLQDMLADKVGSWVNVIIGVIFVLCVLAFRKGVVGELQAFLERRRAAAKLQAR